MTELHDMHCHLDFMANGEDVAAEANCAQSLIFATTVTPAGYHAARQRFDAHENVRVGLGLHPWWVQDGSAHDIIELIDLARAEQFIGEVGLDFSKRHVDTRDTQIEAFTQLADTCAETGGKVLSIHSVHAARETLDLLEHAGTLESCQCIFHWYSGPSDQLKRAIDAGCYFSVNRRMLATGKGREYVKAIPARRLLFETDAPPGQNVRYSWKALREELEDTASSVAAIKGADVLAIIANTSERILECSSS